MKATGLCAKSRRAVDGGVSRVQKLSKFGIVRMPQLKMLENVLKPKETATVHARKHFSRGLGRNWDENGGKWGVALIRSLSVFKGLRLSTSSSSGTLVTDPMWEKEDPRAVSAGEGHVRCGVARAFLL